MEEQGEDRGGQAALRRAGLRRRRDHALVMPSAVFGLQDNDGGGGSQRRKSSSLVAAGGAVRWRSNEPRGKERASDARRPALVFVAQVLLSLVGMVVIPTRLAYELLIQPGSRAGNIESATTSPFSWVHPSDVRDTPNAGSSGLRSLKLRAGGAVGERRPVPIVGGKTGAWPEGGRDSSKGRTGARVLMQTSEEDSFTYTARTQFHLCVAPGATELTEEALRASIVDVFGVEESQVRVGRVRASVCLPRVLWLLSTRIGSSSSTQRQI